MALHRRDGLSQYTRDKLGKVQLVSIESRTLNDTAAHTTVREVMFSLHSAVSSQKENSKGLKRGEYIDFL